jgi:hypothetical protein
MILRQELNKYLKNKLTFYLIVGLSAIGIAIFLNFFSTMYVRFEFWRVAPQNTGKTFKDYFLFTSSLFMYFISSLSCVVLILLYSKNEKSWYQRLKHKMPALIYKKIFFARFLIMLLVVLSIKIVVFTFVIYKAYQIPLPYLETTNISDLTKYIIFEVVSLFFILSLHFIFYTIFKDSIIWLFVFSLAFFLSRNIHELLPIKILIDANFKYVRENFAYCLFVMTGFNILLFSILLFTRNANANKIA